MASTSPAPEDGNVQQQASPFLRIAAELRNRIYEETFDTRVDLTTATPLKSGYGIVLACKQTHAEALGLYYSTHKFRFTEDLRLCFLDTRCEQWIMNIGHKGMKLVKHIELDLTSMLEEDLANMISHTEIGKDDE